MCTHYFWVYNHYFYDFKNILGFQTLKKIRIVNSLFADLDVDFSCSRNLRFCLSRRFVLWLWTNFEIVFEVVAFFS